MKIHSADGSIWEIDQAWIDGMKIEASADGYDLDITTDLAEWIKLHINDDEPFKNARLVHADKALIDFLHSQWSQMIAS